MENFVITFSAKPGKADAVSRFYLDMQPVYEQAKGFRGRQILRARPGTMADALRKVMTAEQMAQHPHPHDDGCVHFIIIEKWDSIEDRMAFSATLDKSLRGDLNELSTQEQAKAIGKVVAERAKAQGIEMVVFDRGGYP